MASERNRLIEGMLAHYSFVRKIAGNILEDGSISKAFKRGKKLYGETPACKNNCFLFGNVLSSYYVEDFGASPATQCGAGRGDWQPRRSVARPRRTARGPANGRPCAVNIRPCPLWSALVLA